MRYILVDMDVHDEVTAPDYRALAEFRFQIRRFLRFSEQAARRAGLEPQHHQVLLALKGLPDGVAPTVGTLAERLQIAHHSAVELVDRLVQRGLIERSRNPADHRQVFLTPTADGEAILRQLTVDHHAELRANGPALVDVLNDLIEDEA